MGINPLAYSDVANFAERVGYHDPTEFFFFLDLISALDKEYLANANKSPAPT